MRTTVTLAPDVAAAVDEMRREGRGVSDAVNELVRRGLTASRPDRRPFVQRTSRMGRPRIPLGSIEEALDILEGPFRR